MNLLYIFSIALSLSNSLISNYGILFFNYTHYNNRHENEACTENYAYYIYLIYAYYCGLDSFS